MASSSRGSCVGSAIAVHKTCDDASEEISDSEDPGDAEQVPSGTGHDEGRRSPNNESAPPQYCTQACLVGLLHGHPLDPNCPNNPRHRRGTAATIHPITAEDLTTLTRKQLARNLDRDCICLERWGVFGATDVLFKITLTKYGYTFVAKGVQAVDEPALAHEARVYARLAPLQGTRVPVYLGTITLQRPYPLAAMARITHMMLMSWAGERLEEKCWPEGIDIWAEQTKTVQALESFGICHFDVHEANLVWNAERQLVMAIDFDKARFLDRRKRKGSSMNGTSSKK